MSEVEANSNGKVNINVSILKLIAYNNNFDIYFCITARPRRRRGSAAESSQATKKREWEWR